MNETKDYIDKLVQNNTRNTYVMSLLRTEDIEKMLADTAKQAIDELIVRLSEYAPEFVEEHREFIVRLSNEI